MKKIIALLSGFVILLSVVGCGKTEDIKTSGPETSPEKISENSFTVDNISGSTVFLSEETQNFGTLPEVPDGYPYKDNVFTEGKISLISMSAFKKKKTDIENNELTVYSVHRTPSATVSVGINRLSSFGAAALKLTVDASNTTAVSAIKFSARGDKLGTLKPNGVYYLIPDGKEFETGTPFAGNSVKLPAGFTGDVVIPFSSFEYEDGKAYFGGATTGINIGYQSVKKDENEYIVYKDIGYIYPMAQLKSYKSDVFSQINSSSYPYLSSDEITADNLDTMECVYEVGQCTDNKTHDGRLLLCGGDMFGGVGVRLAKSAAGTSAVKLHIENKDTACFISVNAECDSFTGKPVSGKEYYLITESGSYSRHTVCGEYIPIPEKFKGYLVMPYSSFDGCSSGRICGFSVYNGNIPSGKCIYLDDLTLIKSDPVTEYDVKYSSYSVLDTDKITRNTPYTLIGGYTGLSLSANRIAMSLNTQTSREGVKFIYGGSGDGMEAISLYADFSETDTDSLINISFGTAYGNTVIRNGDKYYFKDEKGYVSAVTGENDCIKVPQGFKGEIIIPTSALLYSGYTQRINAEYLDGSLTVILYDTEYSPEKTIFIDKVSYLYTERKTVEQIPMGDGGYVTGIYIHPLDNNIKYVRTDVAGMYRYDPENNSWIQLCLSFKDNYREYCIDGFCMDPNDKDIIYLCTGNGTGKGKGGLWKSYDRGNTWEYLGYYGFFGNSTLRETGDCITVDPNNSDVVYFGTRFGGFCYSRDGGKTINKVPTEIIPDNFDGKIGIRSVTVDTTSTVDGRSKNIYVSLPGRGIYHSTDGGENWSHLNGSPDSVRVLEMGGNGRLYATSQDGFFLYSEGKWTDITPSGATRKFNGLSVLPGDVDTIALCRSQNADASEYMNLPIYYSTDGGKTYKECTRGKRRHDYPNWWLGYYFSSATSDIVINPHSPREVWFTDWYGVWMTYDITESATDWYSKVTGIEMLCGTGILTLPEGDVRFIFGSGDNGKIYYTDTDHRPDDARTGYPGLDFAYCYTKPNIIIQATANGDTLTYSEDYGKTETALPTGIGVPIHNIAINSQDPDNIVALPRGKEPYYTTDGGKTWHKSTGATVNTMSGQWESSRIVTPDATEDGTFYYSGSDGIYKSVNSGMTFTRINSDIKNFALISSVRGKTGVLLSQSNGKLYISKDSGKTFTENPVTTVNYFSYGAGKVPGSTALYIDGTVGDESGIFVSDDMGESWSLLASNDEIITAHGQIVGDMQMYGRVYALRQGMGAMVIDKR